jgi:MFS transporter, ACS family, glucarate transporter
MPRYHVLGLLILLFAITYLDRVCISVAGPRMQQELGITPVGWGWVTGMFTLAYCLFEIPAGALGDRIGARRMLTRIVLWWSAFTSLTGLVSSFNLLLLTRFCFGAGQAGAYPSSAIVISRWFPASQRASISGITLMAGQLGGALAPLLIIPIQIHYGWRASFHVFAALGLIWAMTWYLWFRDSPAQKQTANAEALPEMRDPAAAPACGFPWRAAFSSPSVIALMLTAFCYTYSYNFFQTWLHTFLARGRGFTEAGLLFSALPFALATCTTLAGGFVSDALVIKLGAMRGRRSLGIASLGCAALCVTAAMLTKSPIATLVFLSLAYCAITFQQASVLGVSLDISGRHAGTMLGTVSMVSQVGGLLGAVAFGYLVERFGSYDAPLLPMAILLLVSAVLWTQIDASKVLTTECASSTSSGTSRPDVDCRRPG